MNTRILGWALMGVVALVSACGGDSMAEAPAAEPMAEAEPAAAPAEPSGQTMMLGGGTATEVHPGQAGSPHVKVDWVINGANISITYGRPFLKGRVVGDSVEPTTESVWRLGADEATTLVAGSDMMFRDSHIPAGEYTLWTTHMNDEFYLIINSQTGQWGTQYDSSQDVAHVTMDVGELDSPAEQLTLSIGDGTFSFDWGAMTASVPIMVH